VVGQPEFVPENELAGYVSHTQENTGIIDAGEATYALNQGLTSAGISNWAFRSTVVPRPPSRATPRS
jgi:hypothetical protein